MANPSPAWSTIAVRTVGVSISSGPTSPGRRHAGAQARTLTIRAQSLAGLFVQSAAGYAASPALVVDGVTVSYRELGAAAARIAAAMRTTRPASAPRLTGILA